MATPATSTYSFKNPSNTPPPNQTQGLGEHSGLWSFSQHYQRRSRYHYREGMLPGSQQMTLLNCHCQLCQLIPAG